MAARTDSIHDLLFEHRLAWATAVLGDDAVDLGAADDPRAALAPAAAALWLDGYEPSTLDDLRAAARRGTRLVVAVPARSEAAEQLASAFDHATVIPQLPAFASLIGTVATATVNVDAAGSPDRAAWLLVTANLDAAPSTQLEVAVDGQLAQQLERLDEALAALQEANVRLAREHLGRHDAAAGSIVSRLERRAQLAEQDAEHWKGRFEFEQELAMRHHEWFIDAKERMNQPQYRAADRIVHALRRIPGARLLVRLFR
jgi:hypothetical protein